MKCRQFTLGHVSRQRDSKIHGTTQLAPIGDGRLLRQSIATNPCANEQTAGPHLVMMSFQTVWRLKEIAMQYQPEGVLR